MREKRKRKDRGKMENKKYNIKKNPGGGVKRIHGGKYL
jgi:hypothetical protein